MLNLLRLYIPPVADYQVELYEHETPLLRFKAAVFFTDGSMLRIKEYRFSDGSRKYAFHWEAADGALIVRWDNAEHWPGLPTFPHHKHVANADNVQASAETGLDDILRYIAARINKP